MRHPATQLSVIAGEAGVQSPGEDVIARWPAVRPFLLVGSGSIVVGGLIAAVARPAGFDNGPWLAAYLVLVGGVAQIALGVGQAGLSGAFPSPRLVRNEVGSWNASLIAVVVGTLVAAPIVTTIGGVALIGSLALFLVGIRHEGRARSLRLLYQGLVVVVIVSVPIGLGLAWARHG